MKRVVALWLPHWSTDLIMRAEPIFAPPDRAAEPADLTGLVATATSERVLQCDAPRNSGWRPGARWAKGEGDREQAPSRPSRQEIAERIAALPAHRRPPMRMLGRASEAAAPPFQHLRGDDCATRISGSYRHAVRLPEQPVPPLVTAEKQGSRVQLAAVSPQAEAVGLSCGMALTQARALVPDLIVRDADPQGDEAALRALAQTLARRWSPVVAMAGEDGLFIDLAGTAHLHGGEERFVLRLYRLLARNGVTARIAVADTAGAAWAFAHYGTEQVMLRPAGASGDALLAVLPVAALRLDRKRLTLLHRLGIETIGQLRAMDRAPMVRRFGADTALRLDQALGHAPEPLTPVDVPEPVVVSQAFAEPIATAEAIAHWLGPLVSRLAVALTERGLGARSLQLVADRVDNHKQTMRIGLSRPNRDAAHILRLMTRRIEEIEPGYGIDALHIHVRRADPLSAVPVAEHLGESRPDIASLIDTLDNRGARSWRYAPVESDVPERMVQRVSPLDPPGRAAPALRVDDVRRLDMRLPDHPWHLRWPRPARLLRRPEKLDHVVAALPDQPPRRFRWRGQVHVVLRADGPERIAGEWWKNAAERDAIRDYFRVEDETGARFWVFRRGDGERGVTGDLTWYMHGIFG